MLRYPDQAGATRVVAQIVADPKAIEFTAPTFFMNKLGLMINSNNAAEKRKCTEYLKKCMDECSKRLLEYLYRPSEGEMNRKFWMGMGKKPFLGQKFVDKQYSN